MNKCFFLPAADRPMWLLWFVFSIVWLLASWWLDMRNSVVPVGIIVMAYLGYFLLSKLSVHASPSHWSNYRMMRFLFVIPLISLLQLTAFH